MGFLKPQKGEILINNNYNIENNIDIGTEDKLCSQKFLLQTTQKYCICRK